MRSSDGPKILEGVPKPEYRKYSCPFPGCVASVMEYLGEDADYGLFMALSGAAFRRVWQQGDGGNVDLMYFSPLVEEHLFTALGWRYETIPRGNKQKMTDAIKASIDRKMPVLVFGIIGPPECGIVVGYEENGNTLVGYSFFQDSSVDGYYHKSDWYEEDLNMIIVLQERTEKPAEEKILTETLRFALSMGKESLLDSDHVNGLAANLAYADALEDKSFFPIDDKEKMGLQAMLFWDQGAMLYERKHAASYLNKMTERFPKVKEPLTSAAKEYEAIGEETAWIPKLAGQLATRKITPKDSHLGTPEGRKQIADAFRLVNAKEEKALLFLDQALQKLS